MGRSASRALYLATLLGLGLVSVRPVPAVDVALDVVLMPVRVLAEVARPARLLRARAVHAAERRLRDLEAQDLADREQLFRDSTAFVVPDRPELTAGRRFVHAEVLERIPGDLDRIVVQVESGSCEGLVRGMPVVSGEVFVGRLQALDQPQPGQATVDLVTRSDFYVGGRVVPLDPAVDNPEPLRLVVGGVQAGWRLVDGRRTEFLDLDVHNPSLRESVPGRVVVDEGVWGAGTPEAAASGYLLGTTVAAPDAAPGAEHPLKTGLEPALDYGAGLFQVAIVCSADVARAPEHPLRDVLDDRLWRRVGVTSAGDPSPWREGQKLGAGRLDGVQPGAAVASGVRLVGRVVETGMLTSDVALVGDPGMCVPAIARLEGRPEPLVLGRLVSLGREPEEPGGDGAPTRFHWDAVVPLPAGEGTVHATLYTGSGEALVPLGLLIGECELPRGRGPHVLRVQEPVEMGRLGRLWVRMPPPRDEREAVERTALERGS